MIRLLRHVGRMANPSLGYVDNCCLVGTALFMFGWRNPLCSAGISPRVTLGGRQEPLRHDLRLDFPRPDVAKLLGRDAADLLGSCWVFLLNAELAAEVSLAPVAIHSRRFRLWGKKFAIPVFHDTQSGMFAALTPEQRNVCSRAAKGEQVQAPGASSNCLVVPLATRPGNKALKLKEAGLSAVWWNRTLYLRLQLPPGVQVEEVNFQGSGVSREGSRFQFPDSIAAGNIALAFVADLDLADGVVSLRDSADGHYDWQVTCQPAAHISSVLKLLLSPLDFRRPETVAWLERVSFQEILGRLSPILPPAEEIRIERFNQGKCPPTVPRCSVVIPVYGRLDLLQYQVHAFSAYPNLSACEFVFLLDDPRIEGEFFTLIRQLARLFPLRIVAAYAGKNFGYGVANNIAVTIAGAEKILLLNSDVFPTSPGWVDKLLAAHAARPDAGIIGAKLLFDNGMIQHLGMSRKEVPEFPGLSLNDHPHKGMPPSLIALEPLASCPLLTGACLLLEKALFEGLGGFDRQYLLGDFEDSDLCLRVLATGKRNYILHDIDLVHLERQSLSPGPADLWKQNLTLVNGWLYTRRWKNKFAELL